MYVGPPIDDPGILEELPGELQEFLRRCNGYVAFHGGLHFRGACVNPTWHSLRYWWRGSGALHVLFPSVEPSDIPFAEDGLGDQYLLRSGVVYRLSAETGEVNCLNVDLAGFDTAVRADPIHYLSLGPLEEFRSNDGVLKPGELLGVYPPFVFKESAAGVSYRAVAIEGHIRFLADLARQLADVPEGGRVDIQVPR